MLFPYHFTLIPYILLNVNIKKWIVTVIAILTRICHERELKVINIAEI